MILSSWELSLHGKARGTRALYVRCMEMFAEWLERTGRPEGAPGDLLAVSRQDCEAWLGGMKEAGLSASTVRSRWIALRSFYGWLLEEEEIDANPMARVKVDRPNPEPVAVLSREQLAALLKACEGKDFYARRDAALVRTLAATGLRLSECARLRLADVDLKQRTLYVQHGKGDRARFVRVDVATAQALDRYLRARGRHRSATMPWLWLSRSGHLTEGSIPKVLAKRAAMAGIGHVHPHMLRHSFAHHFLAAGGNEGDLQRLGGWESADVMRRYGSALAVDRALAAYDDVNPMEGL